MDKGPSTSTDKELGDDVNNIRLQLRQLLGHTPNDREIEAIE